MKKGYLLFYLLFCFLFQLFAANKYVYNNAIGTKSGDDWNNAYTNLPASLIRGNTYYVASGTYTSPILNDAISGTNYIFIIHPTLTNHGTDTGWSSTFTNITTWNGAFEIRKGYYVIDGGYRNENNWKDTNSYGFKFFYDTGSVLTYIICFNANIDNLQFKNIFFQNVRTDPPLAGQTCIWFYTPQDAGDLNNLLVSKCAFYGGVVHLYISGYTGRGGVKNPIIEYNYFYNNNSDSGHHGSCVDMYYYPTTNGIIRYNIFDNCIGTGMIVWSANNPFYVYGNIIFDCSGGNGLISSDGYTSDNNRVFNNTFVDSGASSLMECGVTTPGTNNIAYNNLSINVTGDTIQYDIHDYNAFSGNNHNEAHGQANIPTSIFINYSNNDFRLASPTTGGTNLLSPYNIDFLGNIRGNDNTFDRGAYEYINNTNITSIFPVYLL